MWRAELWARGKGTALDRYKARLIGVTSARSQESGRRWAALVFFFFFFLKRLSRRTCV